MQRFFDNAEQTTDGILRASCDVAFSGGDNLVIWLWKGWHAVDVATLRCADSRTAMGFIKQTLAKWNVREENFTFDVSGLGQGLKGFFPKALPFNNREAPVGVIRGTYDTIKSQCAFMFADKLISGEVSINPDLLSRKMSGIGFSRMPLQAVLMRERRAIRPDTDRSENAKTLIKKAQMRKIVGHSPDFIEAMLMRTIFDLKRTHRTIPSLGLLGCV